MLGLLRIELVLVLMAKLSRALLCETEKCESSPNHPKTYSIRDLQALQDKARYHEVSDS